MNRTNARVLVWLKFFSFHFQKPLFPELWICWKLNVFTFDLELFKQFGAAQNTMSFITCELHHWKTEFPAISQHTNNDVTDLSSENLLTIFPSALRLWRPKIAFFNLKFLCFAQSDYFEISENVYLVLNQQVGLKKRKFEILVHLTFKTSTLCDVEGTILVISRSKANRICVYLLPVF